MEDSNYVQSVIPNIVLCTYLRNLDYSMEMEGRSREASKTVDVRRTTPQIHIPIALPERYTGISVSSIVNNNSVIKNQ